MKQTLLVLFLLVPAVAHGGTISLVLATRVTAGASAIRVEVDVRNDGDEPALKVAPTVEFQGRVVSATGLEALPPSSPQVVSFDIPLAGVTTPRGVWPVLVRVAYVDGGGYPFEAIHVGLARFGDAADVSSVRVTVPDARVETETDLRVRVERGGFDGPIRLGFATPVGVVITPRIVTLAPDADSTVALTVATTSATVNSRLPLVTMAEYDTAEGHQTVTVVSRIDIGPSAGGSRAQVVAILFVAFLATWAVVAAVTARRRRARDAG